MAFLAILTSPIVPRHSLQEGVQLPKQITAANNVSPISRKSRTLSRPVSRGYSPILKARVIHTLIPQA